MYWAIRRYNVLSGATIEQFQTVVYFVWRSTAVSSCSGTVWADLSCTYRSAHFWSFVVMVQWRWWQLGVATSTECAAVVVLWGMSESGLLLWTVPSAVMDLASTQVCTVDCGPNLLWDFGGLSDSPYGLCWLLDRYDGVAICSFARSAPGTQSMLSGLVIQFNIHVNFIYIYIYIYHMSVNWEKNTILLYLLIAIQCRLLPVCAFCRHVCW
jgi:hypothetical protein